MAAVRPLKLLGKPLPNRFKFYATAEVLEFAKDRAWLSELTNGVNLQWQKNNQTKKSHSPVVVPNGSLSLIKLISGKRLTSKGTWCSLPLRNSRNQPRVKNSLQGCCYATH